MIIKCPQCHEEIEVEEEWAGRKAQCPYCETKFMIQRPGESDVPLSEWSYEDLAQTIKTIADELKTGVASSRLTELKGDIAEIGAESKNRLLRAEQQAEERMKGNIPVVLRFLFPLLKKFRKKTTDEVRYENLGKEVGVLQGKWKNAKLREAELAEEIAAEEWARKKNAEIDAVVRVLVRWVRNAGLPIVDCPHFDRQAGETVHYVGKNVECSIPHSNGDERVGNGTLIVTNKRIVFTGESHRQQYRIANLRDFEPSWRASGDDGQIQISTSDRRREKYRLINSWECSFIIMYLFSEDFRSRIIDAGEEESFQCVRGKIHRYVIGDYAIMCIEGYKLPFEDHWGLMRYLGSLGAHPGQMRPEYDRSCYKYASLWKRMCAEHRFLRRQEAWLSRCYGVPI